MDSLVEDYYRAKLILDLPTDVHEFTMHENPEWPSFQIVLIVGGEKEGSSRMGRYEQDQVGFHPDDDHASSNSDTEGEKNINRMRSQEQNRAGFHPDDYYAASNTNMDP